MDDMVRAVEAQHGSRPGLVPKQIRIAFVLDHGYPARARHRQQPMAALEAQHRRGRVLHGRNGIDELRHHAPARQLVELRLQRIDIQTAVVELRAEYRDAARAQPVHRPLIGELLHDDRISGFAKNFVDEVQSLPRARGHENVVDRGRHAAVLVHLVGQELPHFPVAERAGILAVGGDGLAAPAQHARRRLDQPFHRDAFGIVMAADEIVFRETAPFRCGGGQSLCETGFKIEGGAHSFLLLRML